MNVSSQLELKFKGYYALPIEKRIEVIRDYAKLSENETALLKNTGALELSAADGMIENVIGATHLPLGLGLNFRINKKDYVVPMAVEESSVIAAASHGAKLCLPQGFEAEADSPVMIGQVQLTNLTNAKTAIEKINNAKNEIETAAKNLTQSMEKRGGGFRNFYPKLLKTSRGEMLIVYFEVDVRDAMGANTINSLLEAIAPLLLECIGQGKIRARILSNLADKRKVRAKAVWKKETIGQEVVDGVLDCYELAKFDPYRAATHNKGIMNGIDALLIATGNDWRAVEAGAHSYAARTGAYQPLTHYKKDDENNLVGAIELPMAVGIIGGSINSNPIAKIALKILNVKSANELGMVAACVGLANNFAALRVLGTEGIQKGHMELNIRNTAIVAGASTQEEIEQIVQILKKENIYKVERAKEILKNIRTKE